MLPNLQFGQLRATVPIIQGGMGVGISEAGLASAVANQGGIGVISAIGLGYAEPDLRKNYKEVNKLALQREIQKARKRTSGLLGVNIMMALSDYDELIDGSLQENIDILFLGAGLPLKFSRSLPTDRLLSLRTKIIAIISSAKAAKIVLNFWDKRFSRVPDGFVVEGPMAGGHLGFHRDQLDDPEYALEKLIPQVVSEVKPFEQK